MKVIILLGPPGSGKGTQTELLAEKLGLYYFETSKIGEEAIRKAKRGDFIQVQGKKYFFEKEKELWEKGILWDPPFTVYLVKKKIKEVYKRAESLILAGSPRTLYEAKAILPVLQKLYEPQNIKVILLKLSAEQSIFRNSRRRVCELMRHPILYTKETSRLKKCPLDGSKLVRRKGLDDPETIKVRLKEYQDRTLPLVDYFKQQGLAVKEIEGEQSVADVFKDVLNALKIRD